MALHLWTMTEMRWNRKAVSLGSPEDADKRRPKQAKNLSPSSLIGPKVSIATGQNKYVRLSSWYLSFFNFAALSDAAPATKLVSAKCEWASVSGTVASHARHFPSSQLTKVQPSGRPSPERMRPTGSLVEGMPALTKALWIASFSWAWRVCLPALLRQDNPWLPLASTNAPQGQLWGETKVCSESKTNSDSNCFIVHAEPTRGYGPCVEPVPAVGRPWCKQSSPVILISVSCQQMVLTLRNWCLVPSLLLGLHPYLWDLATVSASPGW